MVIALDDRFGEPLDTYVNGSQVWMRDDGPAGAVLSGGCTPLPATGDRPGSTTEEVFPVTALALAHGEPTAAPIEDLWEGLECFAAYVSDVEPATLAAAASESIGIAARRVRTRRPRGHRRRVGAHRRCHLDRDRTAHPARGP